MTDVVGLCLHHMSPHLDPFLLLVRLFTCFSSAPASFLHSNHEPWPHRCFSTGRSSLAPDQPGAISVLAQPGACPPLCSGTHPGRLGPAAWPCLKEKIVDVHRTGFGVRWSSDAFHPQKPSTSGTLFIAGIYTAMWH